MYESGKSESLYLEIIKFPYQGLTLFYIGCFQVFLFSHLHMKTLSEITHLVYSTSVFKVVNISIMVRRVMVGCGGEGREFFHASDLKIFHFFY